MKKRQIALSATAALLALAAAGCSSGTSTLAEVELSTATFDSPRQLADASEYLVKVQFTSGPVAQVLRDADYLTYWISQATVQEVVAQRPDATEALQVGDTIPIATQLLTEDSDTRVSLDGGEFPTKSELPAQGDKAVAFLVYDPELGGYGPGYQAVGRGAIGADNAVTMRAVHGDLNKDKVPSRAVTGDVKSNYKSKAPWRTTEKPTVTESPASNEPEERLPQSPPAAMGGVPVQLP